MFVLFVQIWTMLVKIKQLSKILRFSFLASTLKRKLTYSCVNFLNIFVIDKKYFSKISVKIFQHLSKLAIIMKVLVIW